MNCVALTPMCCPKAFAGRFKELTQSKGSISGIAPEVALQIESPADNAVITGPDVTVSGNVVNTTGNIETGVTVNGIPATVAGSRFIANHVQLMEGANTITVTATDANGLTATASRSVAAQAGHYLRIYPNIDSGTGPLEVSLRLDGSFTIAKPSVSIAGPVVVTPAAGDNPTEYTATLTVEGAYVITASAEGPDGQIYSDSITVTVMSRAQLENILKSKWEGMRQKIIAGEVQGALPYFPLASRNMFQSLFSDPTIDSVSRLNEIKYVELYTASTNYAQGGLIRQDADGEFSYPITFSRDEYGLWRIYNF